jgi:hypothetical protein
MPTIAGAHSPLITDTSIDQAFQLLRDLPATPRSPWPGQRAFDTDVPAADPTTRHTR